MVDALGVGDALHQPLHVPAAQDGVRSQPQAQPFKLEDVVDELDHLEQGQRLTAGVCTPFCRCIAGYNVLVVRT